MRLKKVHIARGTPSIVPSSNAHSMYAQYPIAVRAEPHAPSDTVVMYLQMQYGRLGVMLVILSRRQRHSFPASFGRP